MLSSHLACFRDYSLFKNCFAVFRSSRVSMSFAGDIRKSSLEAGLALAYGIRDEHQIVEDVGKSPRHWSVTCLCWALRLRILPSGRVCCTAVI